MGWDNNAGSVFSTFDRMLLLRWTTFAHSALMFSRMFLGDRAVRFCIALRLRFLLMIFYPVGKFHDHPAQKIPHYL